MNVERVGRERGRRKGCIEKRAGIFKISKYHQVFVAQVAGEGTVEGLPIRRRKGWRESREVKELIVPIRVRVDRAGSDIERRGRGVRRRVWRRRVRAEKQFRDQAE